MALILILSLSLSFPLAVDEPAGPARHEAPSGLRDDNSPPGFLHSLGPLTDSAGLVAEGSPSSHLGTRQGTGKLCNKIIRRNRRTCGGNTAECYREDKRGSLIRPETEHLELKKNILLNDMLLDTFM